MKQGFVSVNPLRFMTGPKTKKPLPTFVKEKDMESCWMEMGLMRILKG